MASQSGIPKQPHPLPLLKRWHMAFNGCNCPEIHNADIITRWMVIARACVFSMTITSAFIGILLAAATGAFNLFNAILCAVGLVAAHAANNLINDWTDVRKGVDTEDYPRAQYSVHPILGGLTTSANLLKVAFALTLLDGFIMLYLAATTGPLVIVFAVAGLALSLAYTGFLKRYAMGELTALIVWGPLMIGGTVYAITGEFTANTLLMTLPYGLIVASVLVGKHIDKIKDDQGVGVRSLPVILGTQSSLWLNKATFIVFYLLIGVLVVFQITEVWVLVTLFALPRLITVWKIYSQPKPDKAPEEWTVWPLWYVGWAMYFNRRAGELFVLGLILSLVIPL